MSGASPFHILIVDDEKNQREMLEGFLVKEGYRAVAAEDGQKCNEVISRAVELYLDWRSSQRSMAVPYRIGDPQPEPSPAPQAE